MVRARLPRARRPDAPAHLAGGPHGLGAGGRPLAHQPLYRPQGGLGLRCGDHGVHPLVRHLDHAAPGRHRAHTHDHSREQLHAVHGELGGLLDRRHADFRLRGLHAHHQQHLAAPCDARVGVLPRGARGDHGDSHEAADDQHRAASLPEWHRGRRNAARAPLRRGQGDALRQGPGLGGAARAPRQALGRRPRAREREARPVHDRDVDDDPQSARVRTGVDGAHGDALVGADVHRRRRHHGTPRVLEHAAGQHHRLDDLRARPPAPGHHRGIGLRDASSSGRSGAVSRAW